MKDRIFLDTNILVYLSDTGAELHETVKEIFKGIAEKYEIWISRQILREYAVVVSRKEDVEKPLKPQEIINDMTKWEKSFRVIDETQEITENLKNLILKYNLKGKRIHDANIVASMMEFSIRLLFTFNVRDFQVFEEIQMFETQHLEETQSEPNAIIPDGDIQ